jgi:trehalose 6-phosphate phosphatase
VLFDFDGTLAAVVDDPLLAEPRAGVVDRLARLTDRYRRVGVVSGRPVAFLGRFLPPGVHLSGLYGMEEVDGHGGAVVAERFLRFAGPVRAAVVAAIGAESTDATLAGLEVEDKGLSLTMHYRTRPTLGPAVHDLAHRLARAHGLDVRPARMSVELHPPVPTDKGTVVRHLVDALPATEAVLFVGDDVGDIPAFEALDALRRAGLRTLALAVASSELDPRVRDGADLVIREDEVVPVLDVLLAAVDADPVDADPGTDPGPGTDARTGTVERETGR